MDKTELDTAEKKIEEFTAKIETISEALETLIDELDNTSLIASDGIRNKGDKITKKEAKEKFERKYPKIFLQLKEIKELIDGINYTVEDINDEITDVIESLNLAESAISEAKERFEDLGV